MTEQLPRDPAGLLADIRKKTDSIVRQQRIADTEGFSCMGGAIALQRLRRDRSVLQRQLPPLRIVQ